MVDTAPDPAKQAERLERRLARAREENRILEGLIEEKTRSLYLAQEEVTKNNRFLESVLRSMSTAVIVTDDGGLVASVGGTSVQLIGRDEADLLGRGIDEVLAFEDGRTAMDVVAADAEVQVEAVIRSGGAGSETPVIVSASPLRDEGADADVISGAVFVATDISLRKQLEVELRHAQKLESIGQLAAGVAHEINTPIQYVGDGVHFLGDVLNDLLEIHDAYTRLRPDLGGVDGIAAQLEEIDELEVDADVEFAREEIPHAVKRTLDGIDRVATIVRAMKQFSHPGSEQATPEDLNELVSTALTVTANEYKYVADVSFEPGELPPVPCIRGDLSQVILNLVVNAAHAIGERVAGTDQRGAIHLTTRVDGDGAVISVADSGGGVPEAIRDRIFDPFFTTKEPGKGTGQGLAITHGVVERHGGRIELTVEDGVSSIFEVWLPLERAG
ncbi:MAG: ATP-binding protein [Actinomycetota bacterium]